MRIPVWLTLAIAVLVLGFGSYRLWLAFGKRADDKPRKGLYALGKRTHLLIGIIYLLLGGALVATTFGWNPFGALFGPDTIEPTKDTAPSRTIPIDQLTAPTKPK
ncbi:MAG: hypothetical protein H0T89_30595 [Deltaproteobacteria bacterium]|nr:hypothetical protein [Deltaproteobacteria bacterium]MDQ3298905.1 hypothetical protein [Myxococcota bacterium]